MHHFSPAVSWQVLGRKGFTRAYIATAKPQTPQGLQLSPGQQQGQLPQTRLKRPLMFGRPKRLD